MESLEEIKPRIEAAVPGANAHDHPESQPGESAVAFAR